MYTKDKMIWSRHHRFNKGKLSVTKLLTFCDGRALWTRVEQCPACTLTFRSFLPSWDRQTVMWVENELNGWIWASSECLPRKAVTAHCTALARVRPEGQERWFFPLWNSSWDDSWTLCLVLSSPAQTLTSWSEFSGEPPKWGGWSTWCTRKGWENSSAWRREGSRETLQLSASASRGEIEKAAKHFLKVYSKI